MVMFIKGAEMRSKEFNHVHGDVIAIRSFSRFQCLTNILNAFELVVL